MKIILQFTSFLVILTCSSFHHGGSVHAFSPNKPLLRHRIPTTTAATSFNKKNTNTSTGTPPSMDIDYFNPSRNMDMEHVHDCAEHFGKCSIKELEEMRTALHTERLQHQSAGFQPDFAEELDHRLLEEDLDFQLALLKDEMHTLPRWSSPHFITNGKPSFTPPPVMVQSSGGAAAMTPLSTGIEQDVHQRTKKNSISSGTSIQSFIRRSEEMFLIPNGLADIAAFGLALLILSLVPILLQ